MLVTTGTDEGEVTNEGSLCDGTRTYCCDPIPASPTTTSSKECGRIRKEWNTLAQSERNLYINGMLELAKQGKLKKFSEQHGETRAGAQAHGTSAFLPWHRYVLICFDL